MKQGFTLIEVITAIFVLTVGVIGVYILINQALVAASILANRLIAAYLAQEGIELVRNIRDTNWLENLAGTPTLWDDDLPTVECGIDYTLNACSGILAGGFLNIDSNGFYSYSPGQATKFQRKIRIAKPGPNIMEVKVIVTWQERGRTHTFTAQENIYNWLQ